MEIAHDVVGTGPPVFLVSGLAQPAARWRRVARLLASQFTVVSVDNRETPATGPCPGGFTLADLAADVLALADRLGHERFRLAGISMGGMIAQEVVRLAPERIDAAAFFATHGGRSIAVPPVASVLGSGPGPTATEAERLRSAVELWERLTGPEFAAAFPEIVEAEARLSIEHAMPLDGIMRQLQAITSFDPGDALVGSPVPLVVAHGTCDPLVPYENGVRLAEKLGVELVTFEGSGHVLESERAVEIATLLRRHFG